MFVLVLSVMRLCVDVCFSVVSDEVVCRCFSVVSDEVVCRCLCLPLTVVRLCGDTPSRH